MLDGLAFCVWLLPFVNIFWHILKILYDPSHWFRCVFNSSNLIKSLQSWFYIWYSNNNCVLMEFSWCKSILISINIDVLFKKVTWIFKSFGCFEYILWWKKTSKIKQCPIFALRNKIYIKTGNCMYVYINT